jgi:hypothetical protein
MRAARADTNQPVFHRPCASLAMLSLMRIAKLAHLCRIAWVDTIAVMRDFLIHSFI